MRVEDWLKQSRTRPIALTDTIDDSCEDLCQIAREHHRENNLDEIDRIHLEQCSECRQALHLVN